MDWDGDGDGDGDGAVPGAACAVPVIVAKDGTLWNAGGDIDSDCAGPVL